MKHIPVKLYTNRYRFMYGDSPSLLCTGITVYYNTEGNTVTNVDEDDVFTFSAEPK